MILDRYFARRFLMSFAVITGVFVTLIALIDLIEQIRRFGSVGLSFWQLLGLTLLNVPAAIGEILPLLMILSTIVLFVGLARSSELVVTRATGRSGIRALLGPVVVAATIGILAVTTLNPIAAATAKRFQELSDTYRNGGTSVLSVSGEGLWLRQGDAEGQSVIHAADYSSADRITLYQVMILSYAKDGGPVRRVVADRAELVPGHWELTDAKIWPLSPGANAEKSAETRESFSIPTSLTEDRIRDTLGSPTGLSIYDIPGTIRELRAAGFATRKHEVWLQVELARPLFLLAMVLVGAAFTMRHTRFGGTGTAVLLAVLLGFGLYFVRNFAQILGENGRIPVELAAWAPPIASILLTFGLLLHAEDG